MGRPRSSEVSARERVEQAKLQLIFELIALLRSRHYTVTHLAEILDCSKPSIYRYIRALIACGFLIDCDAALRYFIVPSDSDPLHAQFTEAEIDFMINDYSADPDHPLKSSILEKIRFYLRRGEMPKLFSKTRISTFVQQLMEAMRCAHRVILQQYHSARSGDIRDRLIEPIHFTPNYNTIVALDTEDLVCKQFKLRRIGDVNETNVGCKHKELHKRIEIDCFGMTGDATEMVTMQMSSLPYLLLKEEFPMSLEFLSEVEEDIYTFHGPVVNYKGIGRFVMGLLSEIDIISPPSFQTYIDEQIDAYVAKRAEKIAKLV